jgi:hypothetical protein
VAALVPRGGAVSPARRYPRWQDGVGAAVAGLWPVALTLGVLRSPSRYDPFAVFSGLGARPASSLPSWPTTDASIYTTQYTLGTRAASTIVHGHVPWWNAFQGLGAPLAGNPSSGALFPLTPVLLVRDGALVFHLALLVLAGVATYFLLRELRLGPVVATAGGMLYATNGTFAWLANAAATPICFLPLMVLGVERSRRAAVEDRGGGWRWLAVGAGLALLSGFVQTAAVGLVFVGVVAIQRGWTLRGARLAAYARKALAGVAAGIAIAAPLLVAVGSALSNGYVAGHAGDAARRSLPGAYLAMSVAPYLFGRIHENGFPEIRALWSSVGGYAGFALLALAIASLFGRRERVLRVVLAGWVALCFAVTLGVPVVSQLVGAVPVLQHVFLARYLPATWELALVVLAALGLRDLATSSRHAAAVALTTGTLGTALALLVGMSLSPSAVNASRSITAGAVHHSELLVAAVIAALLLCVLVPSRHRGAAAGAIAVAEAAVLFALPLASWPTNDAVDQGTVAYLATHAVDTRFYALGTPSPNFGSQVGARQLDAVGLPVPHALVAVVHTLGADQNAAAFTGGVSNVAGAPTPRQVVVRHLPRLQALGVRFVVAPRGDDLRLAALGLGTVVHEGATVQVWALARPVPIASASGCGVRPTGSDDYVTSCPVPSTLVRSVPYFPGWSATVDGRSVPVQAHDGLQSVALPRGGAEVRFTFLPPYVPLATSCCAVALLGLLVPWDLLRQWRRRRATAATWAGLYSDEDGPLVPLPARVGHPVEPPTGAVPVGVALDEDGPSTSSFPVVTGSSSAADDDGDGPSTSAFPVVTTVQAAADDDGPPTSAVAVEAPARPPEDPPTISVPAAPAADP